MRSRAERSGSSLEQVVAVTVYLKSACDFAAMNDAYRGFWPKDPPTRTTVVPDRAARTRWSRSRWWRCPRAPNAYVIHPAGWIKSPNPYSYAISTGDTLFLSGLVSRNGRDNSLVDGGYQRADAGGPGQRQRAPARPPA